MESQDFEAEQTKKRLRAREAESSPSLSDSSPGRGAGNSAIRRLIPGLRVQLKGKGGARLDETIARAIQAKRGGGQKLDEGTRERMESAMDQDFSGVRVHTDGQADRLSRSVRAEAFTTGSDIFFRSGKYEPESAEGRKLLGHELTHVVQQRNASPPSGMKVSSPEDASERQASDVGESLSGEGAALSREEEPSEVMRQVTGPEEEEEETAQTSPEVMRQGAPEEEEEEMAQTSPEVMRQGAPEEEEEELQASPEVMRQPEEEEVMMAQTSPEVMRQDELPEEDI